MHRAGIRRGKVNQKKSPGARRPRSAQAASAERGTTAIRDKRVAAAVQVSVGRSAIG